MMALQKGVGRSECKERATGKKLVARFYTLEMYLITYSHDEIKHRYTNDVLCVISNPNLLHQVKTTFEFWHLVATS